MAQLKAGTTMDYQQEYTSAALRAVLPLADALPEDVRRRVRLAVSLLDSDGYVSADEMGAELGGTPWVIARRSRRIVERYGPDVICVSPKQYRAAERRAIEKRVPAPGADVPGVAGRARRAGSTGKCRERRGAA